MSFKIYKPLSDPEESIYRPDFCIAAVFLVNNILKKLDKKDISWSNDDF